MSSIQDIRALEQYITDIVYDYIKQMYNEDDVLAISRRCGMITLKADSPNAIKIGKETELYSLKNMVRTGDDSKQEPDCDTISEIVNSWLFIE